MRSHSGRIRRPVLVRSKGIVELADAWGHPASGVSLSTSLARRPLPNRGIQFPGRSRNAFGNDPRVHLVGEEWDIPPVYATMDMLVLPTYREGFPIVLLEAAAMKLAIVATNVPGCVDAVQDGVTGTLIPPYDSRQLVAAVRRYLRDPELSHRHGEAARARVLRDFSDRAMWKAVYEEYVALLENQGIPVPDTSAPATVADTPEKIGVRSHRLAKTSS
jgi:glycosyltransferase involved in cell wall biosynthesis